MDGTQYTKAEVDALNEKLATQHNEIIAKFKARFEQGFASAQFKKDKWFGSRENQSRTLVIKPHKLWWYETPVYEAEWIYYDGISDYSVVDNEAFFASLDDLALNAYLFYPVIDEWTFE